MIFCTYPFIGIISTLFNLRPSKLKARHTNSPNQTRPKPTIIAKSHHSVTNPGNHFAPVKSIQTTRAQNNAHHSDGSVQSAHHLI